MIDPIGLKNKLLRIALAIIVTSATSASGQRLIQAWTPTTPLPMPMAGGNAVAFENHLIYLAPGWGTFVGDVDLATGEVLGWRSALPVPSESSPVAPSSVVIGDFLVLPGYPQSAVAQLAPDGSVAIWSLGPGTTTHSTGGRAVASAGNRIFAAGGGAPYVAFNSVETATLEPDGTLSTWQVLNPLPTPLIAAEARVLGNALYVYGGHSSTPGGDLSHAREVHRAEILADGTIGDWELMGFLLDTRSGSASLAFDGTLHITGGGLHSFLTATVESVEFAAFGQTSAHEWSASLPTALSGHSAAVVGRFGYVLGGTNQPFGRNTQSAVYVTELGPANQPPVADAGPDQEVGAGSACEAAVQLDGTGSYDPDGDPITYLWAGPAGAFSGATPLVSLGLGTSTFSLIVSDAQAASEPDTVAIYVFDDAPPAILETAAAPSLLWPPNHKMIAVQVSTTATDSCGGPVMCSIVSVSSNEPVDGTGDGDTAPDWVIVDADTVLLRAERAGNGPGRVYSVTSACSDDAGNESSTVVEVLVPHSRKN